VPDQPRFQLVNHHNYGMRPPALDTMLVAMAKQSGPARYEIRVRGTLGATLLEAFPGMRARADRTETVLTGLLTDQAALHGVLAEIEALGLELLELRQLSD
jgi:hypothetical protein